MLSYFLLFSHFGWAMKGDTARSYQIADGTGAMQTLMTLNCRNDKSKSTFGCVYDSVSIYDSSGKPHRFSLKDWQDISIKELKDRGAKEIKE